MESRQKNRRAPVAICVIAALILGVPCILIVASDLAGSGPSAIGGLLSRAPTPESLRAFERDLDERSALAAALKAPYARVVDAVFNRGNAKVAPGRDGWLFLRSTLRYVGADRCADPPADASFPRPVAVITDYHRRLTAASVELVVVVVPTKLTLYPEMLDARIEPYAAPVSCRLAERLAALRDAGVEVVDLRWPLLAAKAGGPELYLPRDTHWTPRGARIAAEAVAAHLASIPTLELPPAKRSTFQYRDVWFAGRGDLLEMLAHGAAATPTQHLVRQVVAMPRGRQPLAGRGSRLLLLGDSYAAAFSDPTLGLGRNGGFAEHLADALGRPLDVIAMAGGGVNGAREALAQRPGGLWGKRVVVWEMSERHFANPTDWREVRLPTGEPTDTPEQTPSAERRARVRARLTAKSRIPRDLEYANCLAISRFEVIETLAGRVPEGPLFVAQWARRDWGPVATHDLLEPGAIFELSLGPMELSLERTCWQEQAGLDRTPWWALAVKRAGGGD